MSYVYVNDVLQDKPVKVKKTVTNYSYELPSAASRLKAFENNGNLYIHLFSNIYVWGENGWVLLDNTRPSIYSTDVIYSGVINNGSEDMFACISKGGTVQYITTRVPADKSTYNHSETMLNNSNYTQPNIRWALEFNNEIHFFGTGNTKHAVYNPVTDTYTNLTSEESGLNYSETIGFLVINNAITAICCKFADNNKSQSYYCIYNPSTKVWTKTELTTNLNAAFSDSTGGTMYEARQQVLCPLTNNSSNTGFFRGGTWEVANNSSALVHKYPTISADMDYQTFGYLPVTCNPADMIVYDGKLWTFGGTQSYSSTTAIKTVANIDVNYSEYAFAQDWKTRENSTIYNFVSCQIILPPINGLPPRIYSFDANGNKTRVQ